MYAIKQFLQVVYKKLWLCNQLRIEAFAIHQSCDVVQELTKMTVIVIPQWRHTGINCNVTQFSERCIDRLIPADRSPVYVLHRNILSNTLVVFGYLAIWLDHTSLTAYSPSVVNAHECLLKGTWTSSSTYSKRNDKTDSFVRHYYNFNSLSFSFNYSTNISLVFKNYLSLLND